MTEKSVFVVGTDQSVRNMFLQRDWRLASTLGEADAMCFTGGGDISPFLYGQRAHKTTYPDIPRDMMEVALWKAVDPALPKFGICRGMQLGNVLCGGSMWQDVNNHGSWITHDIVRVDGRGETRRVNSLHHQMVKPTKEAVIIATASTATYKADAHKDYTKSDKEFGEDVEALFYGNFNFLGVQWHPEMTAGDSRDLFFELIDEYFDFTKKKGATSVRTVG